MKSKKPLIGFIGQGWIGKAYADNFEERGYEVVRYSLEKEWVHNKHAIADCDIVFIAVWTPTTPKGFDIAVVESVLPLVGKGKIAVIKSTILPGTTAQLQKKFPDIIVLFGPEFLSITSHVHDAAHPFANLVGMPVEDSKHYLAAERVMKTLPKAPHSSICKSAEAEIFKYTHNASGYTQVILFNLMYDLAQKFGASWDVVNRAVQADPLISKRYSNPIHKSGRGAGGGCFIKDMAALRAHYKKHVPADALGLKVFEAMEAKNIDLLTSTKKDLDLLEDVYGNKVTVPKKRASAKKGAKLTGRMKLLITTQAVDLDDPVLGFFHRWLIEFSKHCESVEVICLREGRHELPANVRVHSLGKESGVGRFIRTARFYRLIFSLRKKYDAVYVHMNPEYIVLGGIFWRMWSKRTALWYNHAARSVRLSLAKRLANVIFTTSPFSASVVPGKTHIMPAGIDTDVFKPLSVTRVPLSIYYQGRIAPAKKVALLCEAIRKVRSEGISVTAMIVGPEDAAYGKELRARFADFIAAQAIVFAGPKRNDETPELFAGHEVSVNLASRSGLDKSVLESCACSTPAIASSEAFGDIVPPELRFKEGDADSLADALKRFFAMPEDARRALGERLRAQVVERHSLSKLVPAVLSELSSV